MCFQKLRICHKVITIILKYEEISLLYNVSITVVVLNFSAIQKEGYSQENI